MLYHPESGNLFETVSDFRAANPLTSFGPLDSAEARASVGLVELAVVAPAYDADFQRLELDGIKLVDGIWSMFYACVDKQMTVAEGEDILASRYDKALTEYLDSVAKSRRWESRITLAVRAGYPNRWQQDAIAFGTWMDECNDLAIKALADVRSGARPMFANTQALIDTLPPMVWPGDSA
jgi:hypothetical protein